MRKMENPRTEFEKHLSEEARDVMIDYFEEYYPNKDIKHYPFTCFNLSENPELFKRIYEKGLEDGKDTSLNEKRTKVIWKAPKLNGHFIETPIMNRVSLKEGRVTFWTKPNTVNFNSTTTKKFFEYKYTSGYIKLIKNSKGELVFIYKYLNYYSQIKKNVKRLSKLKRHFIAVTWSIYKKEIKLYIDGEKVSKEEIKDIEIKLEE